jgi:RHS repeat-associated protein
MGHKAVFERILFYYDTNNRLSQIVDCAGRIIQLEYNRFNQIAKIHLPHPNEVDKTFCAVQYYYENDNLVRVDDALGQPWNYAYQNNLLVQETYRNGLNFYFRFDEYSPAGRCIETWGDEGIYYRSIRYDLDNNITYVRDSLGYVSEYHHDLVLPHKIVDPQKNTTLISYNDYAQKELETNALGFKTCYEYDEYGSVVNIARADGSCISFSYDQNLNLCGYDELAGHPWIFKFNEFSQLVEKVDPQGNSTYFEYQGSLLHRLIDAGRNEFNFSHDQHLNLAAINDSRGRQLHWLYDQLGNVLTATDPRGNQRRFKHDLLGRVTHISEPDGNIRSINYDGLDNITLMQDRYYDVQFKYQGLGRLVSRSQGGIEVKFHYDTEEQLIAIANDHGRVYQYQLDGCGKVVSESGYDGLTRRYVRDPLGRVHKILRPSQRFSVYTYDAVDRVVDVHHFSGEREQFRYRSDGALMAAHNSVCKLEFERDLLGAVVKEIRDECHWVASEYNNLGYRTAIKSSRGFAQIIKRDGLGNVDSVQVGSDNAFNTDFLRNEFGQELQRSMPGGIQSRWRRDKLGRPIEQVIASPNRTHCQKTMVWGLDDRLLKIVDSLQRDTQFHYDLFGNLTAAQYSDRPADLRMPDSLGNLFKSQSRNDREYGPAGQLLAKEDADGITRYQYDPEGNLIFKQQPDGKSWRYQWNAAGFLHSVTRPDGALINFEYDALGRRISKTYLGKTTHWIWDGNNPLHEWVEILKPVENIPISAAQTLASGDKQRSSELQPIQAQAPPHLANTVSSVDTTWVFEPDSFTPMGKLVAGAYFPIISDYLGAPIAMFDGDGQKIWSAEISIWGELTELKGDRHVCPFRWPGQYEDQETGLYYNRFRYFDPDTGCYVSQDPIRLAGGNPTAYSYVANPAIELDILGLDPVWVDPKDVNFTQRTVSKKLSDGTPISELTKSMEKNGFDLSKGKPLNVMIVDGQMVSYDNRRLLAAQNANLDKVPINIVDPDAVHPDSTTGKTWRDKFAERRNDKRNKQNGGVVPEKGVKAQPRCV